MSIMSDQQVLPVFLSKLNNRHQTQEHVVGYDPIEDSFSFYAPRETRYGLDHAEVTAAVANAMHRKPGLEVVEGDVLRDTLCFLKGRYYSPKDPIVRSLSENQRTNVTTTVICAQRWIRQVRMRDEKRIRQTEGMLRS
jgi:hypothetical protein